jgi:hypothetical protein
VLGLWVTGRFDISEDSGSRKPKLTHKIKVRNCRGLKSRTFSLESWRLLLKLGNLFVEDLRRIPMFQNLI